MAWSGNAPLKKVFVPVLATAATVVTAVGMLRWLAPGLLGIPADLQLVRVSDEVPPFLDGVFRSEDYTSSEFLLKDPYLIQRPRPLMEDHVFLGPHDILGFRNREVPNTVDVVAIGDSQTYGNNAPLERTWPSRLPEYMTAKASVYNMSCGAWSGPQYLEVFAKALHLRPRVVVIAFYTGNDPVGAFTAVYGSDRWPDLRLDPAISREDAPRVNFPAPPSERWPVAFRDGTRTVFTPGLRLASNLEDHPAIETAWAILGEIARRINERASKARVAIVFTIIPTKELVHSRRVQSSGFDAPEQYTRLVESEARRIDELGKRLTALPGATYVDLVGPLQDAVARHPIYPSSHDGHPTPAGYDVIASALAPAVEVHLPELPQGLTFVELANGEMIPIVIAGQGYWVFATSAVLQGNGWAAVPSYSVVSRRDFAGLRFLGLIDSVDPARYGPAAILDQALESRVVPSATETEMPPSDTWSAIKERTRSDPSPARGRHG